MSDSSFRMHQLEAGPMLNFEHDKAYDLPYAALSERQLRIANLL